MSISTPSPSHQKIEASAVVDAAMSVDPVEIGEDGEEISNGEEVGVEEETIPVVVNGETMDLNNSHEDVLMGFLRNVNARQPSDPNNPTPPQLPTTHPLPSLHDTDDLPPLPESSHHPDSPTITLITTLRQQINLLTEQGLALNTKLVDSLSRVALLEDSLDQTKNITTTQLSEIQILKKDKDQWEESLSTGLLVDRGTIKEEMQKLVDGLVEEERKRGSAELGRQQVEQEVDDLSATLFEQANTMVAEQRLARIQAESRLKDAQENLSAAETAMRDMQAHLQSLPILLPPPEMGLIGSSGSSSALSPGLMGGQGGGGINGGRRFLANHVPHLDFLSFIHHLRSSKPQHMSTLINLIPPTLSTLSSQPFIAKAMIEDHDPTLRLDTAPDLSWLSRRAITAAIIAGELIIEPVGLHALLQSAPYIGHVGDIGCSMCGRSVFPPPSSSGSGSAGPGSAMGSGPTPLSPRDLPPPPNHLSTRTSSQTSRFSLKPFFGSPSFGSSGGSSSSPNSSIPSSPANASAYPNSPPIFIFRVASTTSNSTTSGTDKDREGRSYPLCATGWCLGRLRATCELWRFLRLGIVEAVWKGEDGSGWAAGTKRYSSGSGSDAVKRSSYTGLGSGSNSTTPVGADIASELGEIREEDGLAATAATKKRPAWGLGFRTTSNEQKSSGWFSKGNTPPQSPKVDSRSNSLQRVDTQELLAGETQDDDRIAVESEEKDPKSIEAEVQKELDEKSDAFEARITEAVQKADLETTPTTDKEQNPEKEKDESATPVGTEPEEAGLIVPDKVEAASIRSSVGSAAGEKEFSTPLGSESSVPPTPEVDEENTEAKSEDVTASVSTEKPLVPTTAPLRLSSDIPRVSLDSPGRPARRTPAPPPLPSRSQARPSLELSTPVDLASNPTTPVIGSEAEQSSRSSGAPVTPDPSAPITPDPSTTPQPPLLPPRTNRQSMTTSGTGLHAGRRYLEGDSWELKTWKEVIRLKQEMFEARVGVFSKEES